MRKVVPCIYKQVKIRGTVILSKMSVTRNVNLVEFREPFSLQLFKIFLFFIFYLDSGWDGGSSHSHERRMETHLHTHHRLQALHLYPVPACCHGYRTEHHTKQHATVLEQFRYREETLLVCQSSYYVSHNVNPLNAKVVFHSFEKKALTYVN